VKFQNKIKHQKVQLTLIYSCDRVIPVVVVVNKMKPFTHASPRLLGNHYRGSCKRLFLFLRTTARVSVTHTAGARDMGLLWESVRESQGRRR
jgi:hypothetical protein